MITSYYKLALHKQKMNATESRGSLQPGCGLAIWWVSVYACAKMYVMHDYTPHTCTHTIYTRCMHTHIIYVYTHTHIHSLYSPLSLPHLPSFRGGHTTHTFLTPLSTVRFPASSLRRAQRPLPVMCFCHSPPPCHIALFPKELGNERRQKIF